MEFITSDKVKLQYTDQGSGTAVLLLSGIGGYKEVFQPIISPLLERGFRVVNLDARNQGASQRTVKGRRISRHALDVKELLDELQLKHVIGIGNSMGAATLFAYLSLFDDRRFLKIVDIDQSPKMITDKTWRFGFKGLTWENFPDYLKFPMGRATVHKINDETFNTMKQQAKKNPYDADLNYPFLVDHAFQDWRDVIVQMTMPLLVIAGEQSPYFDPAFATTTAQLAKKGDAKVIAGAGHLVMAEQPDKFLKSLWPFLKVKS